MIRKTVLTHRNHAFRNAAIVVTAIVVAITSPHAIAVIHAGQVKPVVPSPFDMPDGAGGGDVQRSDFRAEVTDRQTHTLALGPTGSLELKTVSGDIVVVVGAGRDVSVEVLRESRGRTDADARQGLADVRAVIDHQGERATVGTIYPNRPQPPYAVVVSYTVTAPAGTRVSASSASGDVTLRGIKGDISAASASGDIHIADAAQVSVAKSASGDVSVINLTSQGAGGVTIFAGSGDVRLDRITAARVDATSISGSVVATSVDCQRAEMKSTSGDTTYSGAIARGGRYEFLSHSGNVRVAVTGGAGFELQATTFSGDLRTEPPTVLRAATTSQRSLRGTVGDGSAVVVATTFSGDVTVTTTR